jgi:ArsR family transcriptional regulator, arsenate/arsenite/antimonite-responsive transcriptional repressor
MLRTRGPLPQARWFHINVETECTSPSINNSAFRASIPSMADDSRIIEMEALFMALADRTRLRLLNIMADGEVCVYDFTEALGVSQPKISRHLAYLRNSGLVNTRREGKWIYYSINWPENDGPRSVLAASLRALPVDPRAGTGRIGDSSDGYSPEMGDYRQVQPSRPVHNELDEFLL